MIPTQSMENDYKEEVLIAEEYNQNNPNISFIENILTLPHEVLNQIFCFDQVEEKKPYIKYILNGTPIYGDPLPDQTTPIEKKIKCCMRLKSICKHFNALLTSQKIGYLCQNYNQKTKDDVLQKLYDQKCIHVSRIKYRLPALILIYTGANDRNTIWNKEENYTHAFLQDRVKDNDIEFMKILLERDDANPNVKYSEQPLLFSVTTVEMAQLLVDNKVNIHAQDRYGERNVLWATLSKTHPLELMAFYLKHSVDPTLVTSVTGFCGKNACLLHEINYCAHWCEENADDSLKKLKLLLKSIHPITISNIINTINSKGQTPLDMAQGNLHKKFIDGSRDKNGKLIHFTIPEITEAVEKCIALLREHGALTAQEIAEQAESDK